jgi:hypothetical protein
LVVFVLEGQTSLGLFLQLAVEAARVDVLREVGHDFLAVFEYEGAVAGIGEGHGVPARMGIKPVEPAKAVRLIGPNDQEIGDRGVVADLLEEHAGAVRVARLEGLPDYGVERFQEHVQVVDVGRLRHDRQPETL